MSVSAMTATTIVSKIFIGGDEYNKYDKRSHKTKRKTMNVIEAVAMS